MTFFLGAELEGAAGSKWFVLQKEFSQKLLPLKNKNYGDELIHIGKPIEIDEMKFFSQLHNLKFLLMVLIKKGDISAEKAKKLILGFV